MNRATSERPDDASEKAQPGTRHKSQSTEAPAEGENDVPPPSPASAGAMIYIVASEIIPDTHHRLNGSPATAGIMVGLAAMMLLDISLG